MIDTDGRCVTRLLADSPTREDAFGHTNVAKAIAELVTTEPGAKCIGLNGSWGSGKSSVVEILRHELRHIGRGNIDIFVFDAWAHQGDPLRRSFLEQLINRLIAVDWLKDAEAWSEKKEELAKRLDVIQTVSEPILTALGGAIAVSLLLLPLGYELLKNLVEEHPHSVKWGIVGLSMVCIPFLLVATTWLLWRPTWKVWTKAFWTTHRKPYDKRSLLALFLNKSQERVMSSAVRTPDPTSVEFQTIFGQLIEEALGKQERKLLIVIDNLDRVDVKDALAIWATLKTFFDFDARREASFFTRMWLLVPFDERAIRKLWAGDADSSGELGQSFLDKTFQIIFRVSPPVLSDWQAFLIAQLKVALPGHSAADFHRVYRIYDLDAVAGKQPPTPRDIKLFVNRIGAIHRQWRDDISLPVQALYAVLSKSDSILAEDLALKKDEEILRNVPVDMVGIDWREGLAAIHFNVPKERALQVMVGGRIKNSIAMGDEEQLQKLATVPGFTRVLEKVIEDYRQNWATGETKSLGVAASNLAKLTEIDDDSWKTIWDLLRLAMRNVHEWSGFDGRVGDGIVQILKRSQGSGLEQTILASVSKSFPKDADFSKQSLPGSMKPWFEGASVILGFLKDDHAQAVRDIFRVETSAQTYLRFLIMVATDGTFMGLYQFLVPSAEAGEVIAEISKLVSDGRFDGSYDSVVDVMKSVNVTWPWDAVVSALDARLRAPATVTAPEITSILSTLTDFSGTIPEAKASIADLAAGGYIPQHLATVASNSRAAALCMLAIFETVPSGVLASASAPRQVQE